MRNPIVIILKLVILILHLKVNELTFHLRYSLPTNFRDEEEISKVLHISRASHPEVRVRGE